MSCLQCPIAESLSGAWGKAFLLQALVSLYNEEVVPEEVPPHPFSFLPPNLTGKPPCLRASGEGFGESQRGRKGLFTHKLSVKLVSGAGSPVLGLVRGLVDRLHWRKGGHCCI